MREIKFRAWDTIGKKMYLVEAIDFFEGRVIVNTNSLLSLDGLSDRLNFGQVELLEYTGLKDKNGKEIYEGDICKNGDWVEDADAYDYRVEEVIYHEDEAGYSGWNHNEDGMTCEVIGNIYENPELLK